MWKGKAISDLERTTLRGGELEAKIEGIVVKRVTSAQSSFIE